jgi:diguanylate cyclase
VSLLVTCPNCGPREVEELRDLVYKDPLTGLYNRRGLVEEADRVIRAMESELIFASKRRRHLVPQTFSIIFFDLDDFKQINDQYGHEVGDRALKHLASILLDTTRPTDIVARFGGEEFVTLLPGEPEDDAYTAALHILDALRNSPLITESDRIDITASVGVAEFRVGDDTVADVIRRADEAMYLAKESGKDQVVRSSEVVPNHENISRDKK